MNFKFWRNSSTTQYPDEITDYFTLNNVERKVRKHFVIIDTESSSLSIERADLLSVGGIKVIDNTISIKDSFHHFIDTGKSGMTGNVAIHEIMASGKDEKKAVKEVLLSFLKYIGNGTLVAHHAKHDISLINRYLSEHFPGVRLLNEVIDTADLAIKKDQKQDDTLRINPQNYSLDALLKQYSIEPVERHTALGDAYSTALLFLKIR